MFLLLALALMTERAESLSLSLKGYSAKVSSNDGSLATVSMVPDPVTGTLQPIIALTTATNSYVGGIRSYVGGLADLAGTLFPGDRRLDMFDFSAGGWTSLKSTIVSKSGASTTTYSANCSLSAGCALLSSNVFTVSRSGQISLTVDSRRSVPLYANITFSGGSWWWSFDQFSSNPAKFQPDASIYQLDALFYPPSTIPQPKTPNITLVSFYRSFTNDTFARNFANDNAANAAGEGGWIFPAPHLGLIFAQFDVTIDANFGLYMYCNHGACSCVTMTDCQRVGLTTITTAAYWYSFPQAAMCADGFPIGTNNCTWQSDVKLVKAITVDCFNLVQGDPNCPLGFNQTVGSCAGSDALLGDHLLFSLKNCPDIKSTLPWPSDW